MPGQFNLPKPDRKSMVRKVSDEPAVPVYEIWSRSQGKPVATVTTREGATRAVDRRDIAYGANDHYWKRK